MHVSDLIRKSQQGERLLRDELAYLLSRTPDSADSYAVMAEANRISTERTENKAEIHAQFALKLGPCRCNCMFCAFAQRNGVFTEEIRLTVEQVVAYAQQFEAGGADERETRNESIAQQRRKPVMYAA